MIMTEREIKKLLKRYSDGVSTDSEKNIVDTWYSSLDYNKALQVKEFEFSKQMVWKRINSQKRFQLRFYRYAAVLISFLTISITLYTLNRQTTPDISNYASTIKPGGNMAFLVLNQKDSLNLNQLKIGEIIKSDDVKIQKLTDGTISYESIPDVNKISVVNKLIVPRGGQYRIVLADSSIVSLNSESELEFPSQFNGHERRIKMIGEGYFEVAKNKQKPFIVESKGQQVIVLGTKFNVKAYPNDTQTLTTLVEGKIEVSSPVGRVILHPGDQSIYDGHSVQISKAKTDSNVSWKNDLFVFDSEPLISIMQKIMRWYDVDIVFENETLQQKQFTGTISKQREIQQVLQLLEMTGKVKFTTKNKTIYIREK